MSQTGAQTWKSSSFTIEREEIDESGTVNYRMSGPFTAQDMYSSMSPEIFNTAFASPPGSKQPQIYRVDLTHVPYMDSTGLGIMMRLYARCRSRGIQLIVTGAGLHVLELFRLTKVDDLLLAK
jgi:anti-anti-sigma factor